MEALFLNLLNRAITAGYLVLALLVVRLLLKKAPRWISCALWGLVGLRLVWPVSIRSAVSLIPSTETVPPQILYTQQPAIHSGIPVLNSAVNPVLSEQFAPTVENSVNPMQVVTFLASVVWVAGVAVLAMYTLVSWLRLRHRVREGLELEPFVLLCDRIDTPFLMGIFVPRIYLPSSLPEAERQYVLAHEKAHLKRGDNLWKPLGFALLTVFWFQPLLWVAYALFCRDMESACDEKAIKLLGMDSKKPYAQALLGCSVPRSVLNACPLAFGEVNVKGRIRNVLNYKKPAFWVLAGAAVVGCLVAVCFLTDPVPEPIATPNNQSEVTVQPHRPDYTTVDPQSGDYHVDMTVFFRRSLDSYLSSQAWDEPPAPYYRIQDSTLYACSSQSDAMEATWEPLGKLEQATLNREVFLNSFAEALGLGWYTNYTPEELFDDVDDAQQTDAGDYLLLHRKSGELLLCRMDRQAILFIYRITPRIPYRSSMAWANSGGWESGLMRACLNASTMIISSVRHLPIFRFTTKAEVEQFRSEFSGGTLSFDAPYEDVCSFNTVAEAWDDDFFQKKDVLLVYVTGPSYSYLNGVRDVYLSDGVLCVAVRGLSYPEVYDGLHTDWWLTVEVDKTLTERVSNYDAVIG